LSEAAAALERTGAEVVPILSENPDGFLDAFLTLCSNGIRMGVGEYLHTTNPNGSIQTLAHVVAFNHQNPALYALHGQGLLESAITTSMTAAETTALGTQTREEAQAYLESLFTNDNLDVVVSVDNNMSLLYSLAGSPAVTVPAGLNKDGKPFGLTFTGRYLEDGVIISYAYAFEQATHLRQIPPVGIVAQ
jgi:amidase